MQLSSSFFALAIALGSICLVDAAPIKVSRDVDPFLSGLITSSDTGSSAHAVANVDTNGNKKSASASLCIGGVLTQVNGQMQCNKTKGSSHQTQQPATQQASKPQTFPQAPYQAASKPAPQPQGSLFPPAPKPVVDNKKPAPKKTVKAHVHHLPQLNKPVSHPLTSSNGKAQTIAAKPTIPAKTTDANAYGGNGGFASGGSAACSTGNSLIGLNALNLNSCNGGNGPGEGAIFLPRSIR